MRNPRFLFLMITFILAVSTTFSQPKELQVAATSPRGVTQTSDQSQTIFVTFNQPMTPLTAVSAQDGSQVMQIQPQIPGKFRWMGTTTLAFIPEKALPAATLFTVKILPTTASLSGQHLAQPVEWTFETPRPSIVRTRPFNGQKFVELDHTIILEFNQPIDPQAASSYISIQQRSGPEMTYPGFTAQHPTRKMVDGDTTKALLLTTAAPFKKGAVINVGCKAGLRGVEGNLGMSADYNLAFSTYNEFSLISVVSDYGNDPGRPFRFIFSNPVSRAAVAAHLWFDPAVDVQDDYGDWETEEVYLTLPLQAETSYRGLVKAGLKDRFGQELAADAPFAFKTSSFSPYVRMTTGPGVVEAYESHKYPVTFMNKEQVGLQMGKVNPDRIVELMQRIDFSYTEAMAIREGMLMMPDSRSEEAKEFTRSTTWNVKAPRNTKTIRPLNLDAVLAPANTGIVFAQVDNLAPGEDRRYLKALLQVTNMGITAKFSPESNLIWVTNLKDASPVSGASVELRSDSNKVVWTGTTDVHGLALTPGWGKLPLALRNHQAYDGEEEEEGYSYSGYQQPVLWVIVKNGDDVAFSSSTWNEGIQPWTFGVESDWNPQPEKIEAQLFTDRGLYKAGEKVEIKGIVRTRKDGTWAIAHPSNLQFTIKNSRDETILTAHPQLSPFGSFAVTVPLKPGAPLGEYSMTLLMVVSPKKKNMKEVTSFVGSGDFRVEAFRPAEFEVTAKADRKEYIVGDTTTTFIAARYLFGAPLKKEPVQWRVSVSRNSWSPEGYDGYFFGPISWLTKYGDSPGFRVLASQQGMLDDLGSTSLRVPLPVGEIRGTSTLMVEADVTSPSRQTISGRTTVLLHGGEFEIGVKPGTTFLAAGSDLAYDLVAVTPDGKKLPDVTITVRVVQRVWNSVRKAETGGRYTWVSEEVDSTRDSVQVKTGSDPVQLKFKPAHAGFYYLEAEGKDRRGNDLVSQAYFYVSGSDYVAWERSNDDRIELVTDRARYAPGDVAHIMVKSPYENAPALISLEREGILHHYATVLKGSAPQIDVPVTNDLLPNAFVSVVLLQGRVARPDAVKEGDIGRPSFKIGYAKLSVNPGEKQLSVTLKVPQPDFRPGDTVGVDIQVHDAAGKGVPAEVTLSVADLGILNLINYRLPNPFQLFYRERPLAVTTTETRLNLVQQRDYGEKGEDEGGGGAEARAESDVDADGVRKDFRASAYWNPSILTDSTGAASIRFKLPDNLTAFQAMGVAQTRDSRFGYGDQSFTVSKTLILQPSLPRFARVGDTFESGVVIINHSNTEKIVTLLANARGIRMAGGDSSVHVLGPGQGKEVRFSFAAEVIGKAILTFRARAGEDKDGLQWTFPVTAPRLRETVALYESTTDEQVEEAITPPDSVYKELGNIEFTAASTAMVGLSGGMSYLFTYPYGCLEQRCSSILPIILAKDVVSAFHFDVFRNKDEKEVVTKTLDELPLFQRNNGGFSYWKNTEDTWPFVSAYAVYTLIQAKKNGYPVDEQMMKKGVSYLHDVLTGQAKFTHYTDLASRCTRALIVYTLALGGKPDHGYMASLYKERHLLPVFAEAYLLRALFAADGDKSMQAELIRDLSNKAKVAPTSAHFEEPNDSGLEWIYNSTARTTALVAQALIETQPENSLIPKAVRWLLDQQKAGRWRTTQENLFVIDALATYFRTYEKDEPQFRATIALQGKQLLDELFSGRSMKTAFAEEKMSDLVPGRQYKIQVSKSGPGRLYYGVRMNYYPQGMTVAKEEGLQVVKTMEVQDAVQDLKKPFAAGTVVKVTLGVATNQDRNFVVLDDPLPAGFEIINSSFQTTAQSGEDQTNTSWVFQHAEKYDDHILAFADYMPAGLHIFTYLARVTRAGAFAMPATRAEGMYEPEVFGQTASATITIR